MALGTPKYGRTLKVVLSQPGLGPLGGLVLVDWRGGQEASLPGPPPSNPQGSLHVSCVVERHSRPEPQHCTVIVKGLSDSTISKVITLHRAAEQQAFTDRRVLRSGKLDVYAGYQDDAGLLFTGDLAPDGVSTSPGSSGGRVLTLRAQDGRIEYESRFVRRSVAPGGDLRTIRGVLAAAGDYLSGADATKAFESQFPELVTRRGGPAAKEGGFVMFGQSQRANRNLCRDMGLRPFYVDGQVRYVSADTALLGTAVVLRLGDNLLGAEEKPLGYYEVHSLPDHRFRPGLQIFLVTELGLPVGAGVFRMDAGQIRVSNDSVPDSAILDLRPTRPA